MWPGSRAWEQRITAENLIFGKTGKIRRIVKNNSRR